MAIRNKLLIVAAASAIALTGCANNGNDNNGANGNDRNGNMEAENRQHAHMQRDPNVIPSENGPKLRTTNRHGGTSNGMGTSVYSRIGSSGLNAGGFSAQLESRLGSEGIPNVKVFVFDDTVVLATSKREASSSQYDEVQRKVLDPTEGISGKGYSPHDGLGGMTGTDKGNHDNLSMAADSVKRWMGEEIKVLTAEGQEAVDRIEQIRKEATADRLSPDRIAASIRRLLALAGEGS